MIPFLFPHTPFETPTYYVLFLLAFLGAIVLATHRAQKLEVSPVRAVDAGMVTFLFGIIGARLWHVLLGAPTYYWEHPIRVFYLWQGGFGLYGGLILGVLGTAAFLKWKKEDLWVWGDLAAPCILLCIGIGRMGCLSTGCCYGAPTQAFWGLVFSDPRSGAPLHVSLHPTQLLEAIFGFGSAFIFHRIYSSRLKVTGCGLVFALMSYGIFRFFNEMLRGDSSTGYYFTHQLSSSQIVSLSMVASGIIIIALIKRGRSS